MVKSESSGTSSSTTATKPLQDDQHASKVSASAEDEADDDDDNYDHIELRLDTSPHCPRSPALVRDFLGGGKLKEIIDANLPYRRPGVKNLRWSVDQFDLFIIVPCAMMLGCSFPEGFPELFKRGNRNVKCEGFPTEDLDKACAEYIEGKPYGFESCYGDFSGYQGPAKPPQSEALRRPASAVADTISMISLAIS